MHYRADEALELAKQGDNSTLDSLAGSFRGISRGFDGIRENFMDVATPEMRKEYRHLFNVVNFQACNIEKTINNWWKDRKSTRLNSSHVRISYAVFCLKKKKN